MFKNDYTSLIKDGYHNRGMDRGHKETIHKTIHDQQNKMSISLISKDIFIKIKGNRLHLKISQKVFSLQTFIYRTPSISKAL